MAETSVTIALRLAQEMNDSHQPNTGKLQPDSAVDAAQAANLWFNNQSGIDFANLTVDKDWTPGNPTDLVDATACGASIALMSWMVSIDIPLRDIAIAVTADPYVRLADIYAASGNGPVDGCWPTFTAAVRDLPQGVQNNDPFDAFGVTWRQPVSLPQRIFDLVTSEIAKGVPTPQIVAEIQALLTPVAC